VLECVRGAVGETILSGAPPVEATLDVEDVACTVEDDDEATVVAGRLEVLEELDVDNSVEDDDEASSLVDVLDGVTLDGVILEGVELEGVELDEVYAVGAT